MQHSTIKKAVLLSVIFTFLFLQDMIAHPMGLAVTNIKYSKETLTLSTRIFYADFWYEFQNYAKTKNKNYVKLGVDVNDKKDFTDYFNKNLRIWINNSEIVLFGVYEKKLTIEIINLKNLDFKLYSYPDSIKGAAKYTEEIRIKNVQFK